MSVGRGATLDNVSTQNHNIVHHSSAPGQIVSGKINLPELSCKSGHQAVAPRSDPQPREPCAQRGISSGGSAANFAAGSMPVKARIHLHSSARHRAYQPARLSRAGADEPHPRIDPVKTCSCYKGERSNECDHGRQLKRWTAKRKTAPVIEIIQGKATVAEAPAGPSTGRPPILRVGLMTRSGGWMS